MTITARSSDVKCAPGLYQLRTVLCGLVKHLAYRKGLRCSVGKFMPSRYHSRKLARERMLQEIYALPDDASELISIDISIGIIP